MVKCSSKSLNKNLNILKMYRTDQPKARNVIKILRYEIKPY
jgi:hypothetical protein